MVHHLTAASRLILSSSTSQFPGADSDLLSGRGASNAISLSVCSGEFDALMPPAEV